MLQNTKHIADCQSLMLLHVLLPATAPLCARSLRSQLQRPAAFVFCTLCASAGIYVLGKAAGVGNDDERA
jgi:hypothetical protein